VHRGPVAKRGVGGGQPGHGHGPAVGAGDRAALGQPVQVPAHGVSGDLEGVGAGGTPRPKTPKYSQISLAIQAGVSAALATGNIQSNLSSTKAQIEQIIA